jgi:hypothetical protein
MMPFDANINRVYIVSVHVESESSYGAIVRHYVSITSPLRVNEVGPVTKSQPFDCPDMLR